MRPAPPAYQVWNYNAFGGEIPTAQANCMSLNFFAISVPCFQNDVCVCVCKMCKVKTLKVHIYLHR